MAKFADEGRLAWIDSLRAIAALLVLWVHVSQLYTHVGPGTDASRWIFEITQPFDVGRIGVVAFFAISGFVVPFSMKLAHPHPVREFLVTRFFRLYPAFWLSIPLGLYANQWIWGRAFSAGEIFANFTMVPEFFGARPAIGLYWTLAVELVFYACCVVLLLTRSITNYRRIAAIVIAFLAIHVLVVAATWKNGSSPYYNGSAWFLHLAIMLWGTLYRAYMRGETTGAFERVSVWGIALFLVAIYPLVFTFGIGVPSVHSVSYALGVLLFIVGTQIVRIEFPPMPWLGTISYSIYLLHPVVLALALRGLGLLPAASWWRSWHLGAYLVANLLITIGVAAIAYRFVERPAIRLGRRLAKAWFDTPHVAAPAPTLRTGT